MRYVEVSDLCCWVCDMLVATGDDGMIVGWCLLVATYKWDANVQVQVNEKTKTETSFLYAFLSFQKNN